MNNFNQIPTGIEEKKVEEESHSDNSLKAGVILLVLIAVIPYLPIFLIFQQPVSILAIILTGLGGLNGGYVTGYRSHQVHYGLTLGLKLGIIGGTVVGVCHTLIEGLYLLGLPTDQVVFLVISNIVIAIMVATLTATLICSYVTNTRRIVLVDEKAEDATTYHNPRYQMYVETREIHPEDKRSPHYRFDRD